MKALELTPRLQAVGITKHEVLKKIQLHPDGRQQHDLVLRQSGRPKNKPLVSSPYKNEMAKKQVSQVKIKKYNEKARLGVWGEDRATLAEKKHRASIVVHWKDWLITTHATSVKALRICVLFK